MDLRSLAVSESLRKNATLWPTPLDYIKAFPERSTLFCFGDSLTAGTVGYHKDIQDALSNLLGKTVSVARAAYPGYRVGDAMPYLRPQLDLYPDVRVVTFLLGTNDTKTTAVGADLWTSKYYYYEGLRDTLMAYRPNTVFRIFQIPWISPDTGDATFKPAAAWEANKDPVNQMIRALARRWGHEAIDLYAVTKAHTEYYSDGLHLNRLGENHLSKEFIHSLGSKPSFRANRDFIVGMPYTIAGGVQSPSYSDVAKYGGFGLLTCGKSSFVLTDQVGFPAISNGGLGATINVSVSFVWDDEKTVNDVVMINGTLADAYRPDQIVIYAWDGATWVEKGTLSPATECRTSGSAGMGYFNVFSPADPFTARGLKITYTKTYAAGADWLFLGDISVSVLEGYEPAPVQTPVNAVASTGIVSFTGAVADGETVTVGSRVYEFDTDSSVTEGNVAVDVSGDQSASAAVIALAAAITGDTSAVVTAADGAGDTVDLTAKIKGTSGDAITLAKSGTNIAVSHAHLGDGAGCIAGVDGTLGEAGDMKRDGTYLYLCTARNAISDANWRRIALGAVY